LSNAYDKTAKEWKVRYTHTYLLFHVLKSRFPMQARFGVPYSVCGCLPPLEKETKKASSKPSLFSRKGKNKAALTNAFHDLPNNPRPELVSLSVGDAQPTHPSVHNSVQVLDDKDAYIEKNKEREAEVKSRATHLTKSVAKNVDAWSGLILKRGNEASHSAAFLLPVDGEML